MNILNYKKKFLTCFYKRFSSINIPNYEYPFNPISHKSFKSTQSSQPNRSQRGLWQGKKHGHGYRKTFSMKQILRKYKVNTFNKKLYSKILDKYFFLSVSNYALRTIKKYGSLDNYILLSNEKMLDSQFGRYLRAILIYKKKNPDFEPRKLPFTQKPTFKWRKRDEHEYREAPSIYLPPETRRKDISDSYYPPEYFETRIEREKRLELERKLDNETDPLKKDEIKKELNLDKHLHKLQDEMLTLMPVRHKAIRDTFVKYKDRTNAKLHILQTLEKSENYSKLILGEKYKHFSEDYPEVQLILQQTEQDKLKKNKLLAKMYKEYEFDIGNVYEEGGKYDPFKDKAGKEYSISKNKKTITDERERNKKKDIKLKRKKMENKTKAKENIKQ